jgi:hypothetical protein
MHSRSTAGDDPVMRRSIVAGLLIGLPVVALLILLAGGGRVRQCLGGTACAALPSLEGPPVIGTAVGLVATLVIIGAVWLSLAGVVLRRAWRHDRSSLRRSTALTLVVALTIGSSAMVLELLQDQGKRIALETCIGATLLVTAVLAPLVLAWLALRSPAEGQAAA